MHLHQSSLFLYAERSSSLDYSVYGNCTLERGYLNMNIYYCITSAVTNHNAQHRFQIRSHLGSGDLFRLLTNVIGSKIFVSGRMTV